MIKNVNEIGITETYDPCFDYSWVDNLRPVNIIITKSLTDKLIDTLVTEECMRTCILHMTVTGWGGSNIEPGVGGFLWSRNQYYKLIDRGFNSDRVILRVDPIIPTSEGISLFELVLRAFTITKISTVRVSIIDMYRHVIDRMGDEAPFKSFQAPEEMIKEVDNMLNKWSYRYDFVSCAEPKLTNTRRVGCVSIEDINRIPDSGVTLEGSSRQRSECLCPRNKVNIIKRKPGRYPHKCIYCYWRD